MKVDSTKVIKHVFWKSHVGLGTAFGMSGLAVLILKYVLSHRVDPGWLDALAFVAIVLCFSGLALFYYAGKQKKMNDRTRLAAEEFRRSSMKGDS